ncbi:Cannabidiolic acid synthase [Platanthera zijinensis]|uniref:Cannabidiolic acid synthase n=1 Tax=Platanthera zijinensis TaxID=2320716 RepID=A0AAP0GBY4_9ASPA
MKEKNFLLPLEISLLLSLSLAPFPSCPATINQNSILSTSQSFIECLNGNTSFPTNLIFTMNNKNYTALLFSSIHNRRTLTNSLKPLIIITPTEESHIQSSVSCSKKLNLLLRVRSGGHDYEGLSYASKNTPFFVVIDLRNLSSITIDSSGSTAWVQAGATLGELYYAIAMKSRVTAFSAGSCPTVGVGGHFSGGGTGTIMRAHGLAIDNIVDARIVNADGEVLDRESMGEDLFWALRGGGGASFGVILSYKIKLVHVPPKVTVFSITKTLLTEVTARLVSKFEEIAYRLDKRLYIYVILQLVREDNAGKRVQPTFNSLFLGEKEELLSLMEESFPELELNSKDCTEMSWIESMLYIAGHSSSSPLSVLLDRSFKSKSDFFTMPVSEGGWNEIFRWLLEENQLPIMIIEPLGGRVGEVSETETAFPHRKESLYGIQYVIEWTEEEEEEEGAKKTQEYLEWMRRFYEFMAPYVSRNPRGAYLNYRDLDLGVNEEGNTSYRNASLWGAAYFKGNFRRLSQVKTDVDPTNFFRNEQSIPLLF